MGKFVSGDLFDRYKNLERELISVLEKKSNIIEDFSEENRGSEQDKVELEKFNLRVEELNREIREIEKVILA